jgi:hypothetical protein
MEDDNVKVLMTLNLPTLIRGREHSVCMTDCISEGHRSILRSRGLVSTRPRSVCLGRTATIHRVRDALPIRKATEREPDHFRPHASSCRFA